jgi:hypothetical protein
MTYSSRIVLILKSLQMEKIYTSATKLVLLMVTVTLCVGVFYKIIPVEAFT